MHKIIMVFDSLAGTVFVINYGLRIGAPYNLLSL